MQTLWKANYRTFIGPEPNLNQVYSVPKAFILVAIERV